MSAVLMYRPHLTQYFNARERFIPGYTETVVGKSPLWPLTLVNVLSYVADYYFSRPPELILHLVAFRSIPKI